MSLREKQGSERAEAVAQGKWLPRIFLMSILGLFLLFQITFSFFELPVPSSERFQKHISVSLQESLIRLGCQLLY